MKVESIQFLAPLAGRASIVTIHYVEKKVSMDKLEAPFWIYWDDGSKMTGVLFVSLLDIRDNAHLLHNMDNQKAADWVKGKLESLSEKERTKHKKDQWAMDVPIETLKLWQKEDK